ncbi:MAG: hypothetical protein ACUZ8O_08980 [Candidatus Anammoxibacter sp.]
MPNVTIPEKEYQKLKQQSKAYEKLTKRLFESVVRTPVDEVIEDFRKSNIYTEDFLKDIEDGLRKSSYNKRK